MTGDPRDEAIACALGEVTWDELTEEVAARVEAGEDAPEEPPAND
jgi:hypothetical protein